MAENKIYFEICFMHFSASVYRKEFTCFFRVVVDFELINYEEI